MAKNFVVLHDPSAVSSWTVDSQGPLVVNKSAIFFVTELSNPPKRAGRDFGQFARAAMRLRVTDYEVSGFFYTPPGGDPMSRLDLGKHPFVSMTAALVVGSGNEFTTPFVAVNRGHVVAAQRVANPETHDSPVPVGAEASD